MQNVFRLMSIKIAHIQPGSMDIFALPIPSFLPRSLLPFRFPSSPRHLCFFLSVPPPTNSPNPCDGSDQPHRGGAAKNPPPPPSPPPRNRTGPVRAAAAAADEADPVRCHAISRDAPPSRARPENGRSWHSSSAEGEKQWLRAVQATLEIPALF